MNSVEPEMFLYGYLECNDENGDIDKFEFVVADENAQNRVSLTAVGSTPSESLNCKGFTIDSDKIDKAVIWVGAEQVYGIRLVSTYDNKAIDIGSFGKGDAPTLEEFTGRDQLIGFYGSYTDDKVTSLGFLTHDPRCVAEEDPEPNPDVTPGTGGTETESGDADGEGDGSGTVIPGTDPGDPEATDDSEESSSSLGVILGAALGAAVLIGAGVGGFLLWRRRKRNREDNAVDAVKVS